MKKMFKILSQHRNANQNYTESPYYPTQNGYHTHTHTPANTNAGRDTDRDAAGILTEMLTGMQAKRGTLTSEYW